MSDSHGLGDSLRTLSRHAFATAATSAAKLVLKVGKNVLLTRALGPEARGVYGLLNTVPAMMISLGNLGLGLGTIYLGAREKVPVRLLLGNACCFALAHGTLLAVLAWLLHQWGGGVFGANRAALESIGLFILLGIPLTLGEHLCNDLLLAVKDISFLNVIALTTSLVPVAALLLLWPLLGDALTAACWAWLLSMAVVAGMTLRRLWPAGGPGISLSLAWRAIGFGIRGNASHFAGAVTRRADLLITASFLSVEELSYYAAAVSLAEMLLFLPEAVATPFLPMRLEMAGQGDGGAGKAFSATIVKYTLLCMLPILLCTALTARPMLLLLYGREFLPSLWPFLLLLPGMLGLAIYQFVKADLYSLERPGLVSWIAIPSMLLNLALNVLLIPMVGINGAAIASSLCYLGSAAACLCFVSRLGGIPMAAMLVPRREDVLLAKAQLLAMWRRKSLFRTRKRAGGSP